MTKLFEWQMENTLTADYSAGDSSGTMNNTVTFDGSVYHDGSYSEKVEGANYNSVMYDITSLDIVKNTGSLVFWSYHDVTSSIILLRVYLGSLNDRLDVKCHYDSASTEYINANYVGNGNTVSISDDANLLITGVGAWHKWTLRWRTGTENPALSLQLDSNTPVTVDTDLTSWAASSGLLYIGNVTTDGQLGEYWRIDNLKIYDTWDGVDEEISGSVCWGHSTGVTQQNTRTLGTNWTGTGTTSGSGDAEILTIDTGEYMESEIVNTGATTWTIALNQYSAGDSVTIKYKTAATSAGIAGASWTAYSGAFESSGFVKIRLETP